MIQIVELKECIKRRKCFLLEMIIGINRWLYKYIDVFNILGEWLSNLLPGVPANFKNHVLVHILLKTM